MILFLRCFLSLLLLFFYFNNLFTRASNSELRKKRIQENLYDILPQEIVDNKIMGYLSGIEYEKEYIQVMNDLDRKNDSILNFYEDNFMHDLTEHMQTLPTLSILSNEFHSNLIRLATKWFIIKFEENNKDKDKNFNLMEPLKNLGDLVESKTGRDLDYDQCKKIDFWNSKYLSHNLLIEALEYWKSLLPILKSVYKDFYSDGYNCNEILEKYFQEGVDGNLIMKIFIINLDHSDLNHCISSKKPEIKASKLLSLKELNAKLDSDSVIKIKLDKINAYELKGLIENDCEKSLRDLGQYIELDRMQSRIGIFSHNFLSSLTPSTTFNKKINNDKLRNILKDRKKLDGREIYIEFRFPILNT